MELYVYGAHYHRLDGTTNALGYEPVEEAARLARSDRKPTYTCYSCGLWKPTMRQTYYGKWKCGDCFCTGRLDCSCKLCRQAAWYRERATDYLSKRGEEIRAEGMRELEEMDSLADMYPGDMSMAEYASFRRAQWSHTHGEGAC